MIGIIDAGNTRVKAAIFDNHQIVKHAVYKGFEPEIGQFFSSANIKKIMVCSVVELPTFITSNSQFQITVFTPSHKIPIGNLYDSPQSLGLDRLSNAVGAFTVNGNKGPVLSIDLGTCIKFDFVDAKGNFIGGSISPGLKMRLKALNYYTQKLPLIKVYQIPPIVGTSSNESIASGVVNGIITEVDGMIKYYKQQFPSIKVFLTGGDAPFFFDSLKNNIFAFPLLTCHGLNAIAQLNGIN